MKNTKKTITLILVVAAIAIGAIAVQNLDIYTGQTQVKSTNGNVIVGAYINGAYNGGTGSHPFSGVTDDRGFFVWNIGGDFQSFGSWVVTATGYQDVSGSGAPPTIITMVPNGQPILTPTPSGSLPTQPPVNFGGFSIPMEYLYLGVGFAVAIVLVAYYMKRKKN